ncbi:MAG: pyrophosphohydrolase [Candidatus Nomurabacteria bacterium]|jgi:NTP pyrophosphatase (non-canonical NTP hydrolase)|nr:pyrophosphohydrolase [Candidatus Nomurabacteria bacterium]
MSKAKTPLPTADASLRQIQTYVADVLKEHGVNPTASSQFIQLVEEIGEVARALRFRHHTPVSATTHRANLPEELADVLMALMNLASSENVDLFDALIAKEKINQTRVWKSVKEDA